MLAVESLGKSTEPSSIFLSSTLIVVELTVVVVPFTVRLPWIATLLLNTVLPDDEPMLRLVAAPAKFTVVAAPAKFTVSAEVLSKSKLVLVVVNDVKILGLVDKTRLPVPVDEDVPVPPTLTGNIPLLSKLERVIAIYKSFVIITSIYLYGGTVFR
jgi:hypothetical protein